MVRCSEEGERTCPLEEDQRSPVDEQRGRDVRAPGGLLLFHPFLSATRLGGAPCKSCPALSKLSPPHPHPSRFSMSAKRFSWFSMPPSLPHSSRPFCSLFDLFVFPRPARFTRKIFSNHWKMPEKFFQSLENPPRFFQPLENFFPIIGKPAIPPRASGLRPPAIGVRGACKTGGRGAGICGAIPCPGCKADSPGRRPGPRTGRRRR